MSDVVFDYTDYRKYLARWISLRPGQGRGQKSALADAIGSPPSHVSQVLSGVSDFSPEQVEDANVFMAHTERQAEYFDLLVRMARAGSHKLKSRLGQQVKRVQDERILLRNRIPATNAVSGTVQSRYYSSWQYAAVHILVTIKTFATAPAIADALGIPLRGVEDTLDFLSGSGLLIREKGKYRVGTARLHLTNDQPDIIKHHTNWRLQAVRALEREDMKSALHYSSVVSLSAADARRIQELLIRTIEEAKAVIKDSKEEVLYSFCTDFFRLSKP